MRTLGFVMVFVLLIAQTSASIQDLLPQRTVDVIPAIINAKPDFRPNERPIGLFSTGDGRHIWVATEDTLYCIDPPDNDLESARVTSALTTKF